jgi:hypothetical protein
VLILILHQNGEGKASGSRSYFRKSKKAERIDLQEDFFLNPKWGSPFKHKKRVTNLFVTP